ncbi:hypothetical protein ES708_21750 [subsurface metagenome]
MIVFPVFGQTGSYTTNKYFYLPEYGAYGTDEYNEYNLYMQKADTQIEANKTGIANIDLSLYYLKTEINSLSEMETIWEVTLSTDAERNALTYSDVGAEQADAGLTSLAELTYISPSFIKVTATDTYAIRTLAEVKTDLGIDLSLYYLKTEVDTLLGDLTYSDVGAIQDSIDTVKDTHIDWGVGANQVSTDDITEGTTNKYFPGFTSLLVDYAFTDNSANWNTAYGWGDHSGEGYLKVITGESIGNLSDVDLTDIANEKILQYNSTSGKWECETAPAGNGGYTNLTQFIDQNFWKIFYSDGSGNVTELALGADGTYLRSTGATSAPIYDTPAGAGTVTTSGTPVVNDYARFTAATVIEGRSYAEAKDDLGFISDVVDDTTPELGGELDAGAHTIGFTMQTGSGTGEQTIDWKLGNKMQFTIGEATTFIFTAPSNPCHLFMEIIQDGTGGRDIVWPGAVKWWGTEPTWTDGGIGKAIGVAIWYNGTVYWSQGTPWES